MLTFRPAWPTQTQDKIRLTSKLLISLVITHSQTHGF